MDPNSLYYVGLDVHKKSISYCVQQYDGTRVAEGTLPARRAALSAWAESLPGPWMGALEATLFSEWIYDHLKPLAFQLQVAHPARLKALVAGKKKNDRIDARILAGLLRCNLLPQVYLLKPELRQLRQILRYRHLLVRQSTQLKNRVAGLLMQSGVEYNKQKLHGQRYFHQLMEQLQDVPDSVVQLLQTSRHSLDFLKGLEQKIRQGLLEHESLQQRVECLQSIPAVGQITALTWALEIGEVERFATISRACSYCGLTARLYQSAGKEHRRPLSKQRNKYLQTVLVEAAKMAPRWYPPFREISQTQRRRGHHNRATLVIARKLVAYLMAVDRRQQPFRIPASES